MSKRAGKKYQSITVGQLIDLIDYNRDGQETVMISERDDNWQTVYTDSVMLDQISDMVIDSIRADGGVIQIWLMDESIAQYWEGLKNGEVGSE